MKISISPNFNHIAIQLLRKCKTLKSLHQIHSHLITTGLANHTFPLSQLLTTSSSLSIPYSLSIFNHIPNPTIFLYNTFITSLLKYNNTSSVCKYRVYLAFSLYIRVLRSDDIYPNCYTFPSLIKACCNYNRNHDCSGDCKCNCNNLRSDVVQNLTHCSDRWIWIGKEMHCHVMKYFGVECGGDQFLLASLVNLYAKIGDLRVCRCLFEMIREPDVVTWNTMIIAYAGGGGEGGGEWDVGVCMDALYVFEEMLRCGVRPNEKTMVGLISACGRVGALSQGVWAHAYLVRIGLEMNVYVCTSLIDMYAKCGWLDVAYGLFDGMLMRDTLCYNAMIGGFALNGCGRKALECFERMIKEGLVPDDVTFLVVLCGCSHVGLVDEAYGIFQSMEEVYGIKPKIEHYACLVDLLGRSGRLSEAELCINTMPLLPTAIIWRSLLDAARFNGRCEVGEVALQNLMLLEPATSGNYVLLSNIYTSIGRFEDGRRVRKLMKDNAVSKMPGSSLIELDGEVHEFLVGDTSHLQSNKIYETLEEINLRLQIYDHKVRTKEETDI